MMALSLARVPGNHGVTILPRAFYDRPTVDVALDLLGRRLVCIEGDMRRTGIIVETEAYVGPHDLACHASRGRTPRTEVMFGPPGYAYVYLVYGLHCCFNAVTEREGYPAAVLVRALAPDVPDMPDVPDVPPDASTSGPGLLCRALHINRTHNRADLTASPVVVEAGERAIDRPKPNHAPACGPRIGVDYAGEWASRPLRFWIAGNPWVSRRSGARDRRRGSQR